MNTVVITPSNSAVIVSAYSPKDVIYINVKMVNDAGFASGITTLRGRKTYQSMSQSMAYTLVANETTIKAFARNGFVTETADGQVQARTQGDQARMLVSCPDGSSMMFGAKKAKELVFAMPALGHYAQLTEIVEDEQEATFETLGNVYFTDQPMVKLSYVLNGREQSLTLTIPSVRDILANMDYVRAFSTAWVAKEKNHGIPAELIARTDDGYPYLKLENVGFGFVKSVLIQHQYNFLKEVIARVDRGVQEPKNVANRIANLSETDYTGIWSTATFPVAPVADHQSLNQEAEAFARRSEAIGDTEAIIMPPSMNALDFDQYECSMMLQELMAEIESTCPPIYDAYDMQLMSIADGEGM